jgi:hypothetical protein
MRICFTCHDEFLLEQFPLLFTCLPFSVSVSLDFPCTAHASLPGRLSHNCPGLHHNFSEICTKISCCFFDRLIAKFHHARYMTPN